MAQLQKGTTYITGDQVTAANLNALVDSGILTPGAVTDQTAKTVPLAADTILLHSAADTALRKTTMTQLFATPQPLGATTPSSVAATTGTFSSTLGVTGVATLGNGAILGTPASGTVTNLTGTASININGTVGATTASTGAFSTLSATGITTVAAGSAALPAIVSTTGTADTGLWFPAADTIAASTAGTERMRIDNAGNVGIGVTPSAWYSTVRAMQFGTSGTVEGRSNNLSYLAVGTNYYLNSASAANTYVNTSAAAKYEQDLGTHKWYNAASGTAGNAITFTQAMTLDASGNLGVGETSPGGYRLNLKTSAAQGINLNGTGTGGAWLLFANNGTTNGYVASAYHVFSGGLQTDFGIRAENNLVLGTGSTERARIDSSGNVGIGTASPNAKLVVGSNVTAQSTYPGYVRFDSSGNGPEAANNGLEFQNSVSVSGYGYKLFTNNSGDYFGIATRYNSATWTERLVVNQNSGNVGIGTTSPSSQLHIFYPFSGATATTFGLVANSSLHIGNPGYGNQYCQITFGYDSTNATAVIATVNNSSGGNTNQDILFGTRSATSGLPTERLRITAAGNVGIGTTSPAFKLDVMGQAKCSYLFAGYTGADGRVYLRNTSEVTKIYMDGSGNGVVSIGNDTGTAQLTLSLDSATKPSTNTWTIASDSRVKNVTGEYKKGLAEILALRPITYRYNGKAGFEDTITENVSIIAQEAINHFPECVGTYLAKLNPEDAEKTELLNWNGHAVTFALINAIKELTARLAALEAK